MEKLIITNFKEFLEENGIEANQIKRIDVDNYIMSLHYDIVDEYGIEQADLIEEDIEDLIHENFKIND